MSTRLMAAAPVIEKHRADLSRRVETIQRRLGRPPKLSVILVGDDPASDIYVSQKRKRCEEVGIATETLRFPSTVQPDQVREALVALNANPQVDGILIQRPMPPQFLEQDLVYWIDPKKDVDAFHPENTGRLAIGLPCFSPCTPAGVMRLLAHYSIPIAGRTACVVGRSTIVGKPMAQLLLRADATLIQCHSRTPDLAKLTREADIVIAAAGKPGLFGKDHFKAGAVVVDVGVHRTADRRVIGDVRHDEVLGHVSAITPVPGGVGPMTILQLLENTLQSAEATIV